MRATASSARRRNSHWPASRDGWTPLINRGFAQRRRILKIHAVGAWSSQRLGTTLILKLLIGIAIGAAAGGYIVNNMSAEQRRKLEAQIDKAGSKVKNSKVGDSVKDNVEQVASDVSGVVADKIDNAGDKASEKIAGSPTTTV